MAKIIKIEKVLFYLLIFSFVLQTRVIIFQFSRQFNEWTSVYFYITDVLILGIIILWLVRIIKKNHEVQNKFSWEAAEIFLGVFLLAVILSLAISNKFWLSFYGFLKLLELGILFLYVKNNFLRIFSVDWFWRIFIASAVLQGVIAIAQFIKQSSLGLKHLESPLSPSLAGVAKIVINGKNYIRSYGLVPHSNILAAILILAIFGLAYLFIKNYAQIGKWQRVGYAGVLIVLATALFFTFSRTVTLVGFSVLILWAAIIFFRQKNYRRPVIIFIASLFAISFLLSVFFWPYVSARYELQNIGQSQALNLRLLYNQISFDFIKGSPIFGIGQGNFVWSFSNLNLLPAWAYQPVHNIYLLIAAETGLLGLLAFLVFLFFTIKSGWSRRRDLAASCFLSFVSCLFIFGLFDHFLWDIQQGQIIFWLFLGVLASFAVSPHSSVDRA